MSWAPDQTRPGTQLFMRRGPDPRWLSPLFRNSTLTGPRGPPLQVDEAQAHVLHGPPKKTAERAFKRGVRPHRPGGRRATNEAPPRQLGPGAAAGGPSQRLATRRPPNVDTCCCGRRETQQLDLRRGCSWLATHTLTHTHSHSHIRWHQQKREFIDQTTGLRASSA